MKINYTLEYNSTNKTWVVWKNLESEHSYNFYKVYEGSKKECQERLKEIKNGEASKTKIH